MHTWPHAWCFPWNLEGKETPESSTKGKASISPKKIKIIIYFNGKLIKLPLIRIHGFWPSFPSNMATTPVFPTFYIIFRFLVCWFNFYVINLAVSISSYFSSGYWWICLRISISSYSISRASFLNFIVWFSYIILLLK